MHFVHGHLDATYRYIPCHTLIEKILEPEIPLRYLVTHRSKTLRELMDFVPSSGMPLKARIPGSRQLPLTKKDSHFLTGQDLESIHSYLPRTRLLVPDADH